MNESWTLTLACLAGVALGAVFFGGLWWTTRRGVCSQRPALWFIGSLLLRLGLVLGGLYVVGRGDGQRLLVCLLGFVAAQLGASWLGRPRSAANGGGAKEATDAP